MTKNIKYFLAALAVSVIGFSGINILEENFNNYLTAQISQPLESIPAPPQITADPRPPLQLDVKSAISVEIMPNGQQKTLLTENENTPLPIASITKLMSAVVVLDNPEIYNFYTTTTISKTASGQTNAMLYGSLYTGDQYTVGELMKLMLVYSSNDAAYALAQMKGVDSFVAEMNQKASQLGMSHTHYVNPNGLDPSGIQAASTTPNVLPVQDVNHSTASDLATLTEYILKNKPEIFDIAAEGRDIDTIRNGLADIELEQGQQFIGGKTGFTDTAGGCLLFVFQDQNGNKYVNVILGAQNDPQRIADMQKLVNWINI